MSQIDDIIVQIKRLEEEKSKLITQKRKEEITKLKTTLEPVVCYKLYHYYKPADWNWGDYTSETRYYVKEPTNLDTKVIYVLENELDKYIDEIVYN